MPRVVDYPILVFVLSLLLLWLSERIGVALRKRKEARGGDISEDFSVIQGATLTLLGLIIGFSFSMAIGRYDQRKNYEEEEANAIGTEYVRADLLPAADGAQAHALLKSYLDQRIVYYQTRDSEKLREIDAEVARLQTELWASVRSPAAAQPTPIIGLVVSGMNDVLNTQGYTQAAWRNRIPASAWALMLAIAISGSVMIGYGLRSLSGRLGLQMALPLVISISLLLIADIDSPRAGLIRVVPQNLISLADSLRAP
jgi:hypothetical protein